MDEFLQTHRTVLSGDARDALLDALKGEFMPALSGEGDEVGHQRRALAVGDNEGRALNPLVRARMEELREELIELDARIAGYEFVQPMKKAASRRPSLALGGSCQSGSEKSRALRVLRYPAKASPAKPASIIAHVEASGMPAMLTPPMAGPKGEAVS